MQPLADAACETQVRMQALIPEVPVGSALVAVVLCACAEAAARRTAASAANFISAAGVGER